ncbi:MAG TPA: DUF547 domain-containing protein [Thermoanaerobaculia bacterium]|nr:DUF547 domain-containing protein [Thermoanaerobaculia bacterium]
MRTVQILLLACTVALGAPCPAPAADPAADAWSRVLARHAKRGGVDYAALKRDRADLDAFLRGLARARPAGPAQVERKADALAFWINAYNGVVVHHVLDRYPGIDSVKSVDGFFDELTFPVAGEELTLDEIEARGLALGDPRVHFAVVCASTSCPDLRGEPYTAVDIEPQLRDQTRRFLSDRSKGLRYDPGADTLWLSSIFKWYAGDFTGGSTVVAFFARGGVLEWVKEHAPPEIARRLRGKKPAVRYMEYDWGLNDR